MLREVEKQVQGFRTQDGAGVSLVRVLGNQTTDDYDPFLMLDAFDSTNPQDYTAGFPMHPHRGIETVTFLSKGTIVHEDHLGTKASIHDGEAQWLTAGSGAYHSEMPQPAERMLGVQLWLNIPAKYKMTAEPFCHGIINSEIQEFPLEGGKLRLVAGNYQGQAGIQGKYLPLDFYDILLDAHGSVTLDVSGENKSAMVFTLEGEAKVSGTEVPAKTAAKLGNGDTVTIEAGDQPVEILFMCSDRLGEPVAWYGPIVMNTGDELIQAVDEIENHTFIKHAAKYENQFSSSDMQNKENGLVKIVFEENASRSAAYKDGKLIGECEFSPLDGKWIISHTGVRPGHEGQGIARKLVECVIKEARSRQVKILPICSYAKKMMEGKEEYKDLLTTGE